MIPKEWETGPLVGVLLAAGAGRRMGVPKALLAAGDRPLAVIAADALIRGGCDRLVVVVGAEGEEVADLLLAERDAVGTHPEIVVNPDWASGMASTVRLGLDRARELAAAAVVIHLVDLPDVGSEVVARLRDRWLDAAPGDHAWVAAYDGEPRNPVLLTGGLVPDVLGSMDGDRGARRWLDAHPGLVTTVECADIGGGIDLDTPADLEAWRARRTPHHPLPPQPN